MKEAEGPDGHVFEFPDGTSDEVVSRTIREHYASQNRGQSAQSQPGQLDWDTNGRVIIPESQRTPTNRRGQGADWRNELSGALENLYRGIPFLNDARAITGGAIEAASPTFSAAIGARDGTIDNIGNAFERGYNRTLEQSRESADDFRERRPNLANLSEGTGAAVPAVVAIIASGGTATPEVLAARTAAAAPRAAPTVVRRVGDLARNTTVASGSGYLWGEAYGAGAGDAPGLPLQERLQRGQDMAVPSAVLSGAIPPVSALVRRIFHGQGTADARRVVQELKDFGLTRAQANRVLNMVRAGRPEDEVAGYISNTRNMPPATTIEAERAPTLARAMGRDPLAEGAALERQFGPLTRGERSGNADDRLNQFDYETGQGSARRTLDNFNADRRPVIANNVERIATRGDNRDSVIGGSGEVVANELRQIRAAMAEDVNAGYVAARQAAAEAGPINPNAPPSISGHQFSVVDDLRRRAVEAARALGLRRSPVVQQWTEEINALADDIAARANPGAGVEPVTWNHVHQLRVAINDAIASASPAERRILGEFKRQLDDWRQTFAPPEYNRAITNSDRYFREMEESFGAEWRPTLGAEGEIAAAGGGARDLAAGPMQRIIGTDVDSRTVARMFVGENGVPPPSGLALARRLRALNDELIQTGGYQAPSAAPNARDRRRFSRRVGGQTRGMRGMSDTATDAASHQSLLPGYRHARLLVLDELVLNPLNSAARGTNPADGIVRRLSNALSPRGGRAVLQELFTPAEMNQIENLLEFWRRRQVPTGASRSGTPQGFNRAAQRTMSGIINKIAGFGDRVLLGVPSNAANWANNSIEAGINARDARAMIQPPGAIQSRPVRLGGGQQTPTLPMPVTTGALSASVVEANDRKRRLGDRQAADMSIDELERIAAGGQ